MNRRNFMKAAAVAPFLGVLGGRASETCVAAAGDGKPWCGKGHPLAGKKLPPWKPVHLHGRGGEHVLDPARRHHDAPRLRRPQGLGARQAGHLDPPQRHEERRRVDRPLRDARQPREDRRRLHDALPPPLRPRRRRALGRRHARVERTADLRERLHAGGRHAQVRHGLRPRLAGLQRPHPRRAVRPQLLRPHAQGLPLPHGTRRPQDGEVQRRRRQPGGHAQGRRRLPVLLHHQHHGQRQDPLPQRRGARPLRRAPQREAPQRKRHEPRTPRAVRPVPLLHRRRLLRQPEAP